MLVLACSPPTRTTRSQHAYNTLTTRLQHTANTLQHSLNTLPQVHADASCHERHPPRPVHKRGHTRGPHDTPDVRPRGGSQGRGNAPRHGNMTPSHIDTHDSFTPTPPDHLVHSYFTDACHIHVRILRRYIEKKQIKDPHPISWTRLDRDLFERARGAGSLLARKFPAGSFSCEVRCMP